MATSTIKVANISGNYYVKLSDGTMIQWGDSYIDVTATQPDRRAIPVLSDFTNVRTVTLTVVENAYNIQPNLVAWQSGTTWYALNKASKPNQHVKFTFIAIGQWK